MLPAMLPAADAATLFLADTTDTPVWGLVVATGLLVVVTLALVVAGFRALGQLTTAVEELEESKRDRHVMVFAEFGRRWEAVEMTEALVLATRYTKEVLAELFARDFQGPWSKRPLLRRRQIREARERIVLLRIPSYFEDAAIIADVGKLEDTRFRENFGGIAVEAWEKWRPTIERMQDDDPTSFSEFRKLAEAVQKDEKARGLPPPIA